MCIYLGIGRKNNPDKIRFNTELLEWQSHVL